MNKTSVKNKGFSLVIVESPTKAKTISGFLGKNFKIESSYGHIRDLPKSKLGIDVEKDFEPSYVIPIKNRKRVTALKKTAEKANSVILATDEDREGEAIAWHLLKALNLEAEGAADVKRIAFHEITESAINDALNNPRELDVNLVNAQQARRVLDRLVGYKLSPFLWKKVMSHLSAGRVQSVAVRLIVDRENEIRKFIPETYYTVSADLRSKDDDTVFSAQLVRINDSPIKKPGISDKKVAEEAVANLQISDFSVLSVEKKDVKKNPLPPFTTSTLQQEASKRLRFSAKQTMAIAQSLYENGLITYMRTDSLNLSSESLSAAKDWITRSLGEEYAVDSPRRFKTKSKSAQEAHEAIRPTKPSLEPSSLSGEEREKKLYDLIWRRFIASQCPAAVMGASRATISAIGNGAEYRLSASGGFLKFDGFLKIWPAKIEEKILPPLKESEVLNLIKASSEEHQTEPPARYNEASLIKALEEYGIGRPSTYAPIISVIQTRGYVEKNEARRFVPTDIGEKVDKMLVEHFPEIVDIKFTANMESELDDVAEGKAEWKKVVSDFYMPFAKKLEEKYESVEEKKKIEAEPTDEVCDKCGRPMVIKTGRFGRFMACSGYPECKNTKKIPGADAIKGESGEVMKCPKCGEGLVTRKRTKRGRFFYGCSRYPDCDFASWTKPGVKKEKNAE
ncbi:MAG: type I DNA topoisomerase [Candidatus Colwellbacteria bacterium]|nr:type I DNA topoisomerase [Candidatus Colwellbacteria bacterium]